MACQVFRDKEGNIEKVTAPNGEESILYQSILEEVDNKEEALKLWAQVYTPNFKSWFGDWENNPEQASKVVDKNGEPLVVYHGTTSKFDEFSKEKLGEFTKSPSASLGFFFASRKLNSAAYAAMEEGKIAPDNQIEFFQFLESSEISDLEKLKYLKETTDLPYLSLYNIYKNKLNGGDYSNTSIYIEASNEHYFEKGGKYYKSPKEEIPKEKYEELLRRYVEELKEKAAAATQINILPTFLSLKNPEVRKFKNSEYREEDFFSIIRGAKESNDSVIIYNTRDPIETDVYVAFEPNQIKSVFNKGTFSTESDVIYEQKIDPAQARETPTTREEILKYVQKPEWVTKKLHDDDYWIKNSERGTSESFKQGSARDQEIKRQIVNRRKVHLDNLNRMYSSYGELFQFIIAKNGIDYRVRINQWTIDNLNQKREEIHSKQQRIRGEGDPTLEDKLKYMESVMNVQVVFNDEMKVAGRVLGSEHPLTKKYDKPVIELNKNYLTEDTALHEFGHIFIDALGGLDNRLIQQAVLQLEGTPLWQKTKRRYSDLFEVNQDKFKKEVLAQAIGLESSDIFRERQGKRKSRFADILDRILFELKKLLGLNPNLAKELSRRMLSARDVSVRSTEGVQEQREYRVGESKGGYQYQKNKAILDTKRELAEKTLDQIANKIQIQERKESPVDAAIKRKLGIAEREKRYVTLREEMKKLINANDYNYTLLAYMRAAVVDADSIEKRIEQLENDEDGYTFAETQHIGHYLSGYDSVKKIANLAKKDEELNKFIEEKLKPKNWTEDVNIDGLQAKLEDLEDRRYKLQLEAIAQSMEGEGRIMAIQRELYSQEWNKDHLADAKLKLKGQKNIKQKLKEAEQEFINKKIADNYDDIMKKEAEYVRNLLGYDKRDIGWITMFTADPRALNDDLVQRAIYQIEWAEWETMRDTEDVAKELEKLDKRLIEIQGKRIKDNKERFDFMLDKNGFILSEYHSDFYMQYRALQDEVHEYISTIEDHLEDSAPDKFTIFDPAARNNIKYEIREGKYFRGELETTLEEYLSAAKTKELQDWVSANTTEVTEMMGGALQEMRVPIDKWKTDNIENGKYSKLKQIEGESEIWDLVLQRIKVSDRSLPKTARLEKRILGLSRSFYALPQMNKGSFERVTEEGMFEAVKQWAKDLTQIRSTDTEYKESHIEEAKRIFEEDDKPVDFIPIYFRKDIEPKDRSYDVFTLLLMNQWMSSNYQNKSKVLPEIEAIKETIANRKVYQRDSKGNVFTKVIKGLGLKPKEREAATRGLDTNTYKAFDAMVRNRLFGDSREGPLWINQLSDVVRRYTSGVMLIGNYFSGGATMLQSTVMNFMETHGGLINRSELKKGMSLYSKHLPESIADIANESEKGLTSILAKAFDPMQGWSPYNTKFSRQTFGRQAFSQENLYIVTNGAEQFAPMSMMYSYLNKIKVTDKDGNIVEKEGKPVSLYDVLYENHKNAKDNVYRETFNLDIAGTDQFGEWNEESLFKISRKLQETLKTLHGNYSKRNMEMINRYWYGQLFMNMRGWMFPGVRRRWEGVQFSGKTIEELDPQDIRFDSSVGVLRTGTYTEAFRLIKNVGKALIKDKESLGKSLARWNELSTRQKNNVRQAMFEWGMAVVGLTLSTLLVGMVAQASDDDDDTLSYMTAFYTRRLASELLFYINPSETFKILASPAASISMLEKVGHLLQSTLLLRFSTEDGLTWPEGFERYERGERAGQLKIVKDVSDVIPFSRQLTRSFEKSYQFINF